MIRTMRKDVDWVIGRVWLLGEGGKDSRTCLRLSDAKSKGPTSKGHLDYAFTIQFEHVLKKRANKTHGFLDSVMPKIGNPVSNGNFK